MLSGGLSGIKFHPGIYRPKKKVRTEGYWCTELLVQPQSFKCVPILILRVADATERKLQTGQTPQLQDEHN